MQYRCILQETSTATVVTLQLMPFFAVFFLLQQLFGHLI
jgi:hypothetical protein